MHDHRPYDTETDYDMDDNDDNGVDLPNKHNILNSGILRFNSEESVMSFRRKRFEKAQKRLPRDGPGERGEAVILTPEEQKEADRLFKRETFNVVASDKMAMDRSLRDTRLPE